MRKSNFFGFLLMFSVFRWSFFDLSFVTKTNRKVHVSVEKSLKMGKRKKTARKRLQRENDEFDVIEMGDDPKMSTAKNEPKTIPGLSRSKKKKLKNKLKLKASAFSDVAMEEVLSSKKDSK